MPETAGSASIVDLKKKPTLLELVKQKEDAGMARTRNWVSMWDQALRYFLSDQLHNRKEHKDWDWVVLNYIWPAVMQEMAKLSRNFKIIISATEPSDAELAEAFQGFLNWQWKKGLHRKGMRIEQLRSILDGKLYGYRISKYYWDSKIHWNDKVFPPKWNGEIRHRLWRPQEFWASDKEYVNDGDCGTVRYVDLEYAIGQWPDFKKELTEASVAYAETIGGTDTIRGQSGTDANYPDKDTGDQDRSVAARTARVLLDLVFASGTATGVNNADQDGRRYSKISEAYLKDSTEKSEEKDVPAEADQLLQAGLIVQGENQTYLTPDGQLIDAENWPKKTLEWDRPLYPHGKIVIRNEDTILNPDNHEYPHSVWPFIVTPHYLLPHMWQGSDAVTLYRGAQDMINVTVSHLVNNMKQFGDPRIAVEQDALAAPPGRSKKKYKIFSGAGAVIRLARGGLDKFKILSPTPPSNAAVQLYSLFAQEYKNIQGLQDIAQGKKTSGQTTATEAQFLALSSNDRIKLQNIFEEQWVRESVNLIAEMDQYYYEVGRIVRVIGEDRIIGAQEITSAAKEAEFDIDVEAGEGLPFDEEKSILQHEKAYALMAGPPNPMMPDMLRVLNIPGWQKLLDKHAGFAQLKQFQELRQAVVAGQIPPEEAAKQIAAVMIQLSQQQGEGAENARE